MTAEEITFLIAIGLGILVIWGMHIGIIIGYREIERQKK